MSFTLHKVLPHYWCPLQDVGDAEDVLVGDKAFAPLCLFRTETWDDRRRRLLNIFPPKGRPGETKWNWFDVLHSYMMFKQRGLKMRFGAVFLQDEITYYRWLLSLKLRCLNSVFASELGNLKGVFRAFSETIEATDHHLIGLDRIFHDISQISQNGFLVRNWVKQPGNHVKRP